MFAAVPVDYRHQLKSATPGEALIAHSTAVKWYDVAPADMPVPDAVRAEARGFIDLQLGDLDNDAGFVILRRCGDDFYFLLLQIWRGANECWEAVFAKSGDGVFAAFDLVYPKEGALRPTFCVWELGVVAHEARAWTRYLASARGPGERDAWLGDVFTGAV